MDIKLFGKTFNAIADNVNSVIHGKEDVVRLSLVAICAGGHVLFEDVPGVGKSMLARALGQSMEADTSRVQCTPDMLPGDITGSSIIDAKSMEFRFQKGPIFTNVLLVDEINRATPKTQSALLEAMAERNVTNDGKTYPLPRPFVVLATQNPVEQAGTFPLPEAQLDRFLFRLTMGYPDFEAELKVARGNQLSLEIEDLQPVISASDVLTMMQLASEVTVSTAVEEYIVRVTQGTREEETLLLGAGPRATIALIKASKVLAASDGRQHVYPEDVRALLRPVLAHRLMMTPDAILRGETVDNILERVVSRVKPPTGVSERAAEAESGAAVSSNGSSTARPKAATTRGRSAQRRTIAARK